MLLLLARVSESFSIFLIKTVKRPRHIQIPATTRPSRAASHSNLLDADPPRRTRRFSDGSDNRDRDRYRPSPRSTTPDRNGHGNTLPLMSSGYKRLPYQDVPDKPIKTTLLKKKITDGKTSGTTESPQIVTVKVLISDWILVVLLSLQSTD